MGHYTSWTEGVIHDLVIVNNVKILMSVFGFEKGLRQFT